MWLENATTIQVEHMPPRGIDNGTNFYYQDTYRSQKKIKTINQLIFLHQDYGITKKTNCTNKSTAKHEKKNNIKDVFVWRLEGAQWLSGRVLDTRPKGRGLEPHRRHCVVVLEQDIFILA